MKRQFLAPAAVLVCAFAVGCATPRYSSRIELLGQNYQANAKINKQVEDIADEAVEGVEVFVGTLPEGFEATKEGITVADGHAHRILGRVTTTGLNGYNKDRSGYCHIGQFGAGMLCIGMGWMLIGLPACPCVYGNKSNDAEDIEARKAALIMALQRATHAAGGNAVIIDGLGKTAFVDAQTKVQLGVQEMTSAAGWAVIRKRQAVLGETQD